MGAQRVIEKPTAGQRQQALVEDDEQVAAAVRQGEISKAVIIASRVHGAALGRLCMGLTGSQQDAEDVAQETLLDAFKGIESWRQEGSLRAWLFTIARRKCARLVQKKQRSRSNLRLVHDADKQPASAGTERWVLLRQRAIAARSALDSLRPSDRDALLLRYGSGLSFREVAQVTGSEEATARKRVSRALAKLRDQMSEKGQDR